MARDAWGGKGWSRGMTSFLGEIVAGMAARESGRSTITLARLEELTAEHDRLLVEWSNLQREVENLRLVHLRLLSEGRVTTFAEELDGRELCRLERVRREEVEEAHTNLFHARLRFEENLLYEHRMRQAEKITASLARRIQPKSLSSHIQWVQSHGEMTPEGPAFSFLVGSVEEVLRTGFRWHQSNLEDELVEAAEMHLLGDHGKYSQPEIVRLVKEVGMIFGPMGPDGVRGSPSPSVSFGSPTAASSAATPPEDLIGTPTRDDDETMVSAWNDPRIVAKAMIDAMGMDSDCVFLPTEGAHLRLVGSIETLLADGVLFDAATVNEVATGEETELKEKYGKMWGAGPYADLDTALTAIFDGPSHP